MTLRTLLFGDGQQSQPVVLPVQGWRREAAGTQKQGRQGNPGPPESGVRGTVERKTT